MPGKNVQGGQEKKKYLQGKNEQGGQDESISKEKIKKRGQEKKSNQQRKNEQGVKARGT